MVFLIAIEAHLGKETSLEMLKEEKKFDDILFGDFDDSFHNLTYKGWLEIIVLQNAIDFNL